ncbi:MAG: Rnase Y domain-containing protein [Acidobacteriota bacterium]|nr:Rnase Y domain-containing protein [Acidobacteriota bacterium]
MTGSFLLILCILLALGAIALGVAFLRRGRRYDELLARVGQLESEQEEKIRDEVRRRSRREEKRLRREYKRRQSELDGRERELKQRKEDLSERRVKLEERAAAVDSRAEELAELAGKLDQRAAAVSRREKDLEQAEARWEQKLEKVAGMDREEARQRLLERVAEEIQGEVARVIQKADRQARAAAERTAREAALIAMGSVKGRVAGEGTITVVKLPSDEMKGRVIGREGRNIRAFEQVTGVDVLVDDTPQAILLSCWDPLRRAIAARALRLLVEDGRIHPARIEEVVEKTRADADEEARERGEAAAYELGVTGLHERLVLLLGRLSFLRVHGQDLLRRSMEMAQLAGMLADEIMESGDTLRRAALLHAVARAESTPLLTHPAVASADLATRFGEAPEVSAPIRALAQPPDAPRTPEGVLLVTARRLVDSRPGARDENLQRFMDRLAEVEKIALAEEGIERAVAVRAGREMRVHVSGERMRDDDALRLARELAKRIERQVDYPGQIRVLVIRETRAVSYAV